MVVYVQTLREAILALVLRDIRVLIAKKLIHVRIIHVKMEVHVRVRPPIPRPQTPALRARAITTSWRVATFGAPSTTRRWRGGPLAPLTAAARAHPTTYRFRRGGCSPRMTSTGIPTAARGAWLMARTKVPLRAGLGAPPAPSPSPPPTAGARAAPSWPTARRGGRRTPAARGSATALASSPREYAHR